MLHTKFRSNQPVGSGEEDFLRVFTIYGRGGHLGHVTQMRSGMKPKVRARAPQLSPQPEYFISEFFKIKISFPLPKEALHKIWL